MRICYASKCPFEKRTIINCDTKELEELVNWAIKNSESEYALGALATLNYLKGYDDKTPAERIGDHEGISKSAQTQDWIKLYLENAGLPELSEKSCPFPENNYCQWSGDDAY